MSKSYKIVLAGLCIIEILLAVFGFSNVKEAYSFWKLGDVSNYQYVLAKVVDYNNKQLEVMDYENKTYIVKVNFFDRNSYNKDETVELLCDTNNNIIGLDNYFLLTIKSAMLMIVIFLFILIVMFVCIMFSSADKFDVVEDSIQDD